MRKHFILDSNVLIDDPECIINLRNGEENKIYIPYSVLMEIDKLKRKAHLKHIISQVADGLEEYEEYYTIIKKPNLIYTHEKTNDDYILEDIKYAIQSKMFDLNEPIVVTNDKLFRVRLNKFENIKTEVFKDSQPFKSESQLYTGFVDVEGGDKKIPNCFWWKEGALWFDDKEIRKAITYQNDPWGIKPRTPQQNAAIELMLSDHIDIVTLQSEAGFGKTYLALACAMKHVLQKPKKFKKIYVFKPTIELGESLGFLPGSMDDKLAPYMRGIRDLILKLHDSRNANDLFLKSDDPNIVEFNPKKIEILSINYIRGMNIDNAIVIMDEAQNLSRTESRALLTRMGDNVKCFVLGDTNQVDNQFLNSNNNALNWIVKMFKNSINYGHMVLKGNKSRGPITDLVLKTGL